jgi:hypothetical protein
MRELLIVSVMLAGCGAAPKRGENLMESVMTYNDGIRWDRLAVAASRVPPAEREDFVDEKDQLGEDLKITDWEVKRVKAEGDKKARVHVEYTWYKDGEGIVRETHAIQRWEQRGSAWLIVGERRLRGAEMPGLEEPEEEEEEDAEDGSESEESAELR